MNFNEDYYELREKYKEYLAYENDTNSYDILIFVDTPQSLGYMEKSDVICVYDNTTRALLAMVERVRKKDLSLWKRLTLPLHTRRILTNAPIGCECYVQKKGDYIEYQFYRRWWYDLSIQLGSIDISKHFANNSYSGKDESGS